MHVRWSCHLEFSPLHVKHATLVNTFKCLYLYMETPKRQLNYYYYYCQSDSVFCIDLINAILHV